MSSPIGFAVALKLAAFAVVLAISGFHDFVYGPRATALLRHDADSPHAQRLRRRASLLGRTNALLALIIVLLAVAIVRGFRSDRPLAAQEQRSYYSQKARK